MSHATRQSGFGLVPVLAIVLLLAVAAFVAYRVWDAQTAKNESSTTQQTTSDEQITSDSELQSTDKELENTDVEGSDLNDLEAQTNY